MEAKDTVMSDNQLEYVRWREACPLSRMSTMLAVAEAQAEISFKAGIKEVVEWMKRERNLCPIPEAKLKEWGMDQPPPEPGKERDGGKAE